MSTEIVFFEEISYEYSLMSPTWSTATKDAIWTIRLTPCKTAEITKERTDEKVGIRVVILPLGSRHRQNENCR